MKIRFMTLAAAMIAVGIMASCSSDGKKNQSKKSLEELSVEDVIFDDESLTINYKIPSPLEMFIRMKNREVPFNPELPNKASNGIRYVDRKSTRLNSSHII